MNKLLGLLDALEAHVLEAKKVPLTQKVVVEEAVMLDLCDKIRTVIKSEEDVIEKELSQRHSEPIVKVSQEESTDIVEKTLEKASKVKKGADDYAEYVLTQLQLTVTKLQSNLMKLEKNIESGRKMIDEKKEFNENQEEGESNE